MWILIWNKKKRKEYFPLHCMNDIFLMSKIGWYGIAYVLLIDLMEQLCKQIEKKGDNKQWISHQFDQINDWQIGKERLFAVNPK